MPTSQVPIANSELHHLSSTIVDQKYEIKVRLPEHYHETTESYPILYLLDGDHAFAMASDIVQYLIYGGHIPDLIIASPAYGDKNDPENGGTNMRARDLLPFPTPWSDTMPGGVEYIDFFKQELIPFVESQFRVDPSNRTIAGYSAGAIFVLFALFQNPTLFQHWIALDGLLPQIMEIEEDFATSNSALLARLFLASGDDMMTVLSTKMDGRNYVGFTVEHEQLNKDGHFTVAAEGLTKGLVAVFREAA